jgi:hypothetical protein
VITPPESHRALVAGLSGGRTLAVGIGSKSHPHATTAKICPSKDGIVFLPFRIGRREVRAVTLSWVRQMMSTNRAADGFLLVLEGHGCS